jgi:hypothetical protein
MYTHLWRGVVVGSCPSRGVATSRLVAVQNFRGSAKLDKEYLHNVVDICLSQYTHGKSLCSVESLEAGAVGLA